MEWPETEPWYEPQHPRPEHAHALACTWTARPTGRHRLVPDACLDLLCLLPGDGSAARAELPAEPALVLCGPERRAWTFELPPGTVAVGVRFRPGWASLAFDLDVATVLDRRIPYEEVVGRDEAAAMRAAITAPGPLAEWARRMEAALAPRLHSVGAVERQLVDHVTTLLTTSPRPSQQQLAAALGLTPRHLHRRLVRTFGYGAATIGRILRFQRFLAVWALTPDHHRRDRPAPGALPSMAELAATAGYADQAHLARDCRALTGLTVRRFLAEWFPTFPDMSDPFKTGVPFAATMGG